MNGDNLIARTRRILRDVVSDTMQGEFWNDETIRLALNTAQDIFINTCLRVGIVDNLSGLFTNTGYIASGTLPADYLHYASAKVGDNEADARISKVYLGGDGSAMFYSLHDATLIIQDTITFIRNGTAGNGILYYYKYPSYIGATSLGDAGRADFDVMDFEPFIYNDILANHASVLLGFKEVQTQRDYKKNKQYMQDMFTYPMRINNYTNSKDISIVAPKEQGRQQSN